MTPQNQFPLLPAERRYPAGPEPVEGGVSFRVWAPKRRSVAVQAADGGLFPLQAEGGGYFSATIPLAPGDRYQLKLDDAAELFADPASAFQPDGLNGASEIIDHAGFPWNDQEWEGIGPAGQVIYEMHVGTFTPEGTWSAAIAKLDWLVEMGITVVEMMPVGEFDAQFGWGYDGVLLYAPTQLYGRPDDLRSFVNAAHKRGLGVILDVVYNHLGAGSRFEEFADTYFRDDLDNEWGRSLELRQGGASQGSRDYFVANAVHWIENFHFDGLRLDAAHAMVDDSEEHVLAEIERRTRAVAAPRKIFLVAENEPEHADIARSRSSGGYGFDAIWHEDFHHTAMVAASQRREGYVHDHAGTPQEFISSAKYGLLFQGQRYDWQDHARGQNAFDLRPFNFVNFLQNHDQIANSATGQRFWQKTSPAKARTLTAILLLLPQTPMLFQGQEFGATSPFHYFLGTSGEILRAVRDNRRQFMTQVQSARDTATLDGIPEPGDIETMERSKLDWSEIDRHPEIVALHRDLIRLRKTEIALATRNSARAGRVDGAVIGPSAFLLRYFGDRVEDDRLLLVNLGEDLPLRSIPDPLSAPPEHLEWELFWSSEDRKYDGDGRREMDLAERVTLIGNVALLFRPRPARPRRKLDKTAEQRWQHEIF